MLNNNLYLAIDQGGQSTRLALFDIKGNCVCVYSAPCATQHRQIQHGNCQQSNSQPQEFIEQNGEEILAGIRSCLVNITEFLGGEVTRIKGAGFAGQGSSLLCWHTQTGAALTPVLSWQDIRGEAYINECALTQEQVQAKTGLRLSPHYGASKIRWCLEHDQAVIQARADNCLTIGPIVSYIFWHLLGPKNQVDPGHAQRTLLWNLARNQWDETLLAEFKIPATLLPKCLYHNQHFGDLQLGTHRIPFCASARDQGASLFARGTPAGDSIYLNLGTGAFIQRLSKNMQAPAGLLVSPLWLPQPSAVNAQPHPIIEVSSPTCYQAEFTSAPQTENSSSESLYAYEPLYAWEATVNGAAAATAYLQDHTGLVVTPADMQQALGLNPTHECYFLNAVGGLSAPYWRTDLHSRFSDNLSPHEKILAWLESVLFQCVINIQRMESLGVARSIIISGGFSKADALCQKFADLTHIKVERSDNSDATLQGIGYLAAAMPATWAPQLQCDIFIPNKNEQLAQRFTLWKKAMEHWLNES